MHGCMCIFCGEYKNITTSKWGDTKIAERGRSVLVMCACCRSAELIPHQRGWMDASKDRGVVCVISVFKAGGSVRICVGVYTHTHRHSAQMGYCDVSPGVGMRHLEGPKNPDGLNLDIYVFVYVYKVHMCMYMIGGGMISWTKLIAFFLNMFFLSKKKS